MFRALLIAAFAAAALSAAGAAGPARSGQAGWAITDLESGSNPADFCGTYANAINRHGQIVGGGYVGCDTSSGEDAFIWQNARMTNLGALGKGPDIWTEAVAINDEGWVVGGSDTKN
ncbi:MAG: hypothetical protein ACXVFF_16140, partial [Gaiellaceae bacterium]